jgi:hypothetical protein
MVVVSGVEDGLVFRFRLLERVSGDVPVRFADRGRRVGAGQDADDVGRLVGADGGFDVGLEADGEFDRVEAALAGGVDFGVG